MQTIKNTPIYELLSLIRMEKYTKNFTDYGVDSLEDVFSLTPDDWEKIKILPFHRNKIIHGAASLKEASIKNYKQSLLSSNAELLHNFQFSSNGPYQPNVDKPQSILNFDALGYAVAQSTDCFMKFTFPKLVNIYGIIIGNNLSGGWNSSYLEGAQIQVRLNNSQQWQLVHTIKGMSNNANSAYLVKIDKTNVREVKFWKASHFSVLFVHFV